MATVSPTKTSIEGRSYLIQWVLGDDDTGASVDFAGAPDRSVQIAGTFDSATVVFQGSNDGVNWSTLTDPQGNAISVTAAALEGVSELTRYVRPVTSGGLGSTDITVTLIARSTMR